MTEQDERMSLLGRLSTLGWFGQHGEVAATAALAFLLEEPSLRDAFLANLQSASSQQLDPVSSFLAEQIHGDGARPDLEGQDGEGRPVVVVEAKFAASLTADQVASYLVDQMQRLGPQGRGVLVVLVPAHRKHEAENLLPAVRSQAARAAKFAGAEVDARVTTWDSLLDLLDGAAQKALASQRQRMTADLLQLRDMCLTLAGLDIQPLGSAVCGQGWRKREKNLHTLVDRVTAELSDASVKLLPTGRERIVDYYRRYISGKYGDSWLSVGVVADFADQGLTPLWARYNRKTAVSPMIRERLGQSRFAADARYDNGHVWLPLHALPDVSGTAVVADLAKQVQDVHEAITGAEHTARQSGSSKLRGQGRLGTGCSA